MYLRSWQESSSGCWPKTAKSASPPPRSWPRLLPGLVGDDPVADGVDVTRTSVLGLDQTLPAPPPGRTTDPTAADRPFAPGPSSRRGLPDGGRSGPPGRPPPTKTQARSAPGDSGHHCQAMTSYFPVLPGPVLRIQTSCHQRPVVPPRSPAEARISLPQPTPQTPETSNAYLEILHTNRLKKGWLTVWIDGERVASRPLSAPKGLAKRVSGEDVRLSVPVRPGQRRLEIRISGAAGQGRRDQTG